MSQRLNGFPNNWENNCNKFPTRSRTYCFIFHTIFFVANVFIEKSQKTFTNVRKCNVDEIGSAFQPTILITRYYNINWSIRPLPLRNVDFKFIRPIPTSSNHEVSSDLGVSSVDFPFFYEVLSTSHKVIYTLKIYLFKFN